MFVIYDKETKNGSIREEYLNKDISKPIDLDDNLEIYKVIDVKPDYNVDSQRLKKDSYLYTDDLFEDYKHLKIANVNYIVEDIPQDEIIERLNNSLGAHLDNSYPLWERAKHSGIGNYILWNKTEGELTSVELATKAKIDNTYAWITQCRAERDEREQNYKDNDIFPSFEWEERPTN